MELTRGEALLGVNPYVVSSHNYPTLEMERIAIGEKVINANHAPIAQEYLKKGCPQGHRAKLWALVLGSTIKENVHLLKKILLRNLKILCFQHRQWFAFLKESVFQFDLMIDKLIIKDIHLTAANDDQYFVFEDVLFQANISIIKEKHWMTFLFFMFFQIMLCFSRDSEVLEHMAPKTQMQVILKGKVESTLNFPPSGTIPFHGFTMYGGYLSNFYIINLTLIN